MEKLKRVSLPLFLGLSLIVAGCGGQKSKTGTSDFEETYSATDESRELELYGDSDSGKAGALRTVNFPFDSSRITSTAQEKLNNNVEFLKNNPNVQVQIEGHCDERGGVQYNLALGERRASAVKRYLVAQGVSSSRITIVSLGKEKPIAFGSNEEAWAKNRRANFVVTAK